MERVKAIKLVLWVVLGLNLAVAAAKLLIGYSIGSLAMIADGFHSTLDGSSNVIGLVGILAAARPPDREHPYGHQKYEAFSSLGIALLLAITALEVVQAGLARLGSDESPIASWAGVWVMLATMAVNLGVSSYERRQGERWHSSILIADAGHTRSDLFVSLSVLAGLGAVWMGWYWLDVAVAFMIAALILYIAYGILRRVSQELVDTAAIPRERIAGEALAVPGVISTGNVRSRGSVPSLFIDLEIQVSPELRLADAHALAHQVRDRCMAAFEASDVVVHVEPADASASPAPPQSPESDPGAQSR